MKLTHDTIVVRGDGLLSWDLSGEAVLLEPKTGMYFGLNEVGTAIWNLLENPCTPGAIEQSLLQTFDVAPAVCRADTLAFLHKLAGAGLIEVRDALAA